MSGTSPLHRLLLVLAALACGTSGSRAQSNQGQTPRYQANVANEAGLTVVVFDTANSSAALYLPEDLVEGENVTGRLEPVLVYGAGYAFALEADGLRTTTSDKQFIWRVPKPGPDGFVSFTLRRRDGPDKTALAVVQLPVATRAPVWQPVLGHTADEFVIPEVAQAGETLPIMGPFEGDATRTSFEVGGTPADVLAQSRRRLFVRFPGAITGRTQYRFTHRQVEQRGTIQAVKFDLAAQRTASRNGDSEKITVRARGLQGWTSPLMLTVENRTPARIQVSNGTARSSGRWISLEARNIKNDGTLEWVGWLIVETASRQGLDPSVMLWIPKTADEQILGAMVRRALDPLPQSVDEPPAWLTPHAVEALPPLARLMSGDHDLSWWAMKTMLALDPDQAANHALGTLPGIMDRQASFEILYFYTDRVIATPSLPYRRTVHDAAVSVLTEDGQAFGDYSWPSTRVTAIRSIGLLGSEADLPLLLKLHDAPALRVAAEGALARLGSAPHIARIEAVLAAPVPTTLKSVDAFRIIDAIKNAQFSGRREFVPLLCRHLDTHLPPDPRPTDVVQESPAYDAAQAIAELSGQRFITDFTPYCPRREQTPPP